MHTVFDKRSCCLSSTTVRKAPRSQRPPSSKRPQGGSTYLVPLLLISRHTTLTLQELQHLTARIILSLSPSLFPLTPNTPTASAPNPQTQAQPQRNPATTSAHKASSVVGASRFSTAIVPRPCLTSFVDRCALAPIDAVHSAPCASEKVFFGGKIVVGGLGWVGGLAVEFGK